MNRTRPNPADRRVKVPLSERLLRDDSPVHITNFSTRKDVLRTYIITYSRTIIERAWSPTCRAGILTRSDGDLHAIRKTPVITQSKSFGQRCQWVANWQQFNPPAHEQSGSFCIPITRCASYAGPDPNIAMILSLIRTKLCIWMLSTVSQTHRTWPLELFGCAP